MEDTSDSSVAVLGPTGWAYTSPSFQGLSFRFGLRCTDPELGRHFEAILGTLQSSGPVEHWYSLCVHPHGGWSLLLDDANIARVGNTSEAVAWLLWDINRAVAEESSEYLLFHAAGVQIRQSGVLLAAPSGSGKTTLCAGLVKEGLDYLSDEVIAYDMSSRMLIPYPKSLSFKEGARNLYVSPGDLRAGCIGVPCEPRFVILPRYVSGGKTCMRTLSCEEAFLSMATNTVNLDRHGSQGARVLGELVGRCEVRELQMSELEDACRLVLEVVDG